MKSSIAPVALAFALGVFSNIAVHAQSEAQAVAPRPAAAPRAPRSGIAQPDAPRPLPPQAGGEWAETIRYGINREIGGMRGPAGRTLVLRGSNLDETKASELEEDLNVMSRVLDKAMEKSSGNDPQDKVLGIVVTTLPGSRTPQNLYLDGYGVLFILNARFPLTPPSGKENDVKETRRESNSTWDEARRELYGNPGQGPGARGFGSFGGPDRNPVRYDAERVEALKREVLESLKDAANIRHLKSDDMISVTVLASDFGPFAGDAFRRTPNRANNPSDRQELRDENAANRERAESERARNLEQSRAELDRSRMEVDRVQSQMMLIRGGVGKAKNSALTFRVKKTDVEAFAKGKLDLDGFRKKASVTIY